MRAISTVRTATKVRTYARSVTSVANGLVGVLLTVMTGRQLSGGCLMDDMDGVLMGLRVWLGLKQLRNVHLEIYDDRRKVIERWDLPITYATEYESDERVVDNQELIEAELSSLGSLPDADSYRLVVTTSPNSVDVPGWHDTKLSDVSHLVSHDLAGDVLSTAAIRVSGQVFRRRSE